MRAVNIGSVTVKKQKTAKQVPGFFLLDEFMSKNTKFNCSPYD
jgi:hypothetical protein